MRRSSVPLVGFPHQAGQPPVAVIRLPRHDVPVTAHAHDFLTLFYANAAADDVVIDGRRFTVAPGDLFVLAPGQVIAFTGATPAATDGWVVWFPADTVRGGAHVSWRAHPLLFPFAAGADRPQRLRIAPADRPAWTDRFTALHTELTGRRDGYREAALAHLTLLLVAAARHTADVPGQLRAASEPLLAAVFDIVENRYTGPLSLTDVAAEVGLTAGHLTTVVREKTGRTVQQWITQRRLQEARRLLTETDLPVAAVSRRCGYPDVSYFTKRFRLEHGVTPAQWRTT
ncbi:AraC family transcriptional regulator [Actinoplanes hulinensis]|uniref:AraC family transcriptional regulator n=1 Tax=Actinoplanes hulinensis TaxID=1144547 RepID=A0ABS7B474_9ACTN|nr:AraC family transcriptional regulator [Actinoplanes hulinensis]MBW6435824.1 AraC family transcriptional regulator [Actinoplanes hulinensis]